MKCSYNQMINCYEKNKRVIYTVLKKKHPFLSPDKSLLCRIVWFIRVISKYPYAYFHKYTEKSIMLHKGEGNLEEEEGIKIFNSVLNSNLYAV